MVTKFNVYQKLEVGVRFTISKQPARLEDSILEKNFIIYVSNATKIKK